MTHINFYHLTQTDKMRALPRLMEKVVDAGQRAIIWSEDIQSIDMMNTVLWTYSTKTFIPHGVKVDGFSARQPIYLTTQDENPNRASVIAVMDEVIPDFVDSFEKCLYLFNGKDREHTQLARQQWKAMKDKGYSLDYWKQGSKGNWEKVGV